MIGIIHYAYGAPTSIDGVEGYFSHILKGKPVPPPMLNNLKKSFSKAGFPDFIAASTQRIVNGLNILLADKFDEPVKAYNAYKHTAPFIDETVEKMLADGVTKFVALPINPIHSKTGSGAFHEELNTLLEGKDVEIIHINNWYNNPTIVELYAERVRRAFNWLSTNARENAYVLFTVHSQPVDPKRNEHYVAQFNELSTAIAKAADIENFRATYRSSGGKENWLAPDVKDAIRSLHAEGVKGIVTCELLSLCADVESYFEIGEESKQVCDELGVEFAISEFPSDSFDTVYALATIVEQYVKKSVTSNTTIYSI